MRVFRVENKDCVGPFHVIHVYHKMQQSLGILYHGAMPTPWSEGLHCTLNHLCACKTLEELMQKWFPPSIHGLLRDEGFEIVEYEVPEAHVQFGKKQVVFLAEQAHVVGASQF